MTIGKKIGLTAFILTELIILISVLAVFLKAAFHFNFIITLNVIIGAQTTVLIVTWGAKASSNFAKKKEKHDI